MTRRYFFQTYFTLLVGTLTLLEHMGLSTWDRHDLSFDGLFTLLYDCLMLERRNLRIISLVHTYITLELVSDGAINTGYIYALW